MTDEKNNGPAEIQDKDAVQAPAIEDWASAFAALEVKPGENIKPDEQHPGADGNNGGDDPDAAAQQRAAQGTAPAQDHEGAGADVAMAPGADGGQVSPASGAAQANGEAFTDADVTAELEGLTKHIEEQAVKEVQQAMVKKGIKNTNGVLGATINDPDIRKVEDGIVTFWNPETGQQFTGENPRKQAAEWVKEYNDELKETFNQIAGNRIQQLTQELEPYVQLLKFSPKFEKLDPIRQGMMEEIIQDYELYDDQGNHVGYSCDLEKVLTQVNRQIQRIQQGAGSNGTTVTQDDKPKGPALDMPASAGAAPGQKKEPKSLAEAMEMSQDSMLESLRGGKK